jgi:hypothetical protein
MPFEPVLEKNVSNTIQSYNNNKLYFEYAAALHSGSIWGESVYIMLYSRFEHVKFQRALASWLSGSCRVICGYKDCQTSIVVLTDRNKDLFGLRHGI